MKPGISHGTGDVFKPFPFRVVNTRDPLKRLDERMIFEKRLNINSKLTPGDKLRGIVKRNDAPQFPLHHLQLTCQNKSVFQHLLFQLIEPDFLGPIPDNAPAHHSQNQSRYQYTSGLTCQ